jgi:hypothetical protein
MEDTPKDTAPIDLHAEIVKLGGIKVGQHTPSDAEIDFSDIAGVRVVRPPTKRAETKPTESVESEEHEGSLDAMHLEEAVDF